MAFGGMGFSFRTVFLFVRAEERTTAAFKKVGDQLDKMKYQLQQQANQLMFAGAAYLGFAGMVGMAMMKIIQKSTEGAAAADRWGKTIDVVLGRLGLSLLKVMGPAIDTFVNFLEVISRYQPIMNLISILILLGTALLVCRAVAALLSWGFIKVALSAVGASLGLVKLDAAGKVVSLTLHGTTISVEQLYVALWKVGFIVMMLTFAVMQVNERFGTIPAVITVIVAGLMVLCFWLRHTDMAVKQLLTSVNILMAGFTMGLTLVMLIAQAFGKLPAIIFGVVFAIIALAVAIMALKGIAFFGTTIPADIGIMALALGAGAAMGVALVATSPNYQIGTRAVRDAGLAVVEPPEVIFNPANQLPTTIAHGLRGEQEAREVHYHLTLQTGDVYTKADRETLLPWIMHQIRQNLDNKV